jgi:hypothetical protein
LGRGGNARRELAFDVVGGGGGAWLSAGGAFERGVESLGVGFIVGVVEGAGVERGSRASASGAQIGGASDAGAHLGWRGSILVR